MAFGPVLRSLRKAAGLTQEALAERASVTTQAVSALESGLRKGPYPKTVSLLADALGLDDSERAMLEAAAAAGRPSRGSHAKRATERAERLGHLPSNASLLFGREREVAEAAAALHAHRLLTLTGSGGIGKTRVAVEVARRVERRFPGGAWFCDLAPVAEEDQLVTSLAASLGLELPAGREPFEALVANLGAARALLVLDNCEHLARATASASVRLLRECAGLSLLATSRVRLALPGEAIYVMPSLAVPDPALANSLTVAEALAFGAVELFWERAAAVRSGRRLARSNVGDVVEICRRLDGIPLAIELAAAHVRFSSVAEVARRLGRPFALLRDDALETAPRHRTLQAAFDWSYEHVRPGARAVFRALGIFASAFTFEHVLHVCASESAGELDVLGSLAELVDASLVVADVRERATEYRLLETIRTYARDRLAEAKEWDSVAARHLAYFCEVSGSLEAVLPMDDVRAALRYALCGGDLRTGATLAAAIGVRWEKLGLANEGIVRLRAFIAALPESEVALQGRLWSALAFLLGNALHFEESLAAAQRSLAFARRAGDDAVLFNALRSSAIFAALHERGDVANRALREAETIAARHASPLMRLQLTFARGHVCLGGGDFTGAALAFEDVRRQARSAADDYREVSATILLAETEHRRGETARAIDLLNELRAARRLEAVDETAVLVNLGGYLASLDDAAGVHRVARELFSLPASDSWSTVTSGAFEHIALVEAQAGRLASAARLFGFAGAWYARLGSARQYTEQRSHERLRALLETSLSSHDFEALRAEGATFTTERAAREVLLER